MLSVSDPAASVVMTSRVRGKPRAAPGSRSPRTRTAPRLPNAALLLRGADFTLGTRLPLQTLCLCPVEDCSLQRPSCCKVNMETF